MHKIKVVHIIEQLGKGGSEGQLYEFVKGVNREKFDIVVVSLTLGGYWSKEIQKLNIQVIELPRNKRRMVRMFIRLLSLVKLLRELNADLVHTDMFTANLYGRIAAIIARVPCIIAHEQSVYELGLTRNKYQILIDKILASLSHGIICNSYIASKSLINKYSFNAKKIFTIHNGIDASLFNRLNTIDRDKPEKKIVGTVGRLYPVKNYKLFLDMAKDILNRCSTENIGFLIIGDGPLKDDLKEYSKKVGIRDNVEFLGVRNDIPELLQNMDIFVMTSFREGISNAIMEAMVSGLPVVATDVGGNSELVIEGETGFLCPLDDTKLLADKVFSLINNETESKRMGENGKKRMLNEFAVENMIKETENVYLRLLGEEIK